MWHIIVSNLNDILDRLIAGFIATCHLYPFMTLCFLAILALLTIAFWLEVLNIKRDSSGDVAKPQAIRLKR